MGKFHTILCHSCPSLSSRYCCEAFYSHRYLQGKPDPLCPLEGLLEFLRGQAGGEGGSHSRPSGKPRFPKQARGRARKSSGKRHSCHGTGDAPQASSSPGEKGAEGRRLPPGQCGRSAPSSACQGSHPSPLKEVNQGLVFSPLPPTPAFPYGLFTGPS